MDRLLGKTAFLVLLVAVFASGLAAATPPRPTARLQAASTRKPDTFGVDDYTVTSLSDLAFTAGDGLDVYTTNFTTFYRYYPTDGGGNFLTGAEIPAGAVIDWIGLGTCDQGGDGFLVSVYEADDAGGFTPVGGFHSTGHAGAPCATDYNAAPLSYQVLSNARRTIQVWVQQSVTAPTDGSASFSGVEIWWHRTVSPAPASATFNDVPTGHPFFRYIEALAASGITGGCGNGNYCPDAPLTRGQMAVFLSKALGLHFPGDPAP